MGNYKRGHQYWGEKQENLVCRWLSASTDIEYTRIYNALLPQLNHMAELIINRYFSVPTASKCTEIKRDAIQEVFLKLNQYKPNLGKSGSYSFCSMIIKHYVYERLVLHPQWKKHTENHFDYIQDYPENYIPMIYEEREEMPIETILNHFKKLKAEVDIEIKEKIKLAKYASAFKAQHYKLEIITLCIEYVEKFDSFNAPNVIDYIFLHQKYDLTKKTIAAYFRRTFNIAINVTIGCVNTVKEDSVVEAKYNMLEDDYTPEDAMWYARQRKKRRYRDYPDMEKYLFM